MAADPDADHRRAAGDAGADADASALEVRLLLDAIHARYGYDLRGYSAASMQRRVFAALAKYALPHLGELQHRIVTDAEFFASVLHDLTVQVSELFRDPSFYVAFRAHVLPILRTYPLLRIWHAGCATGEEAYASAIMLSEAGLYDRAQIYATDLSARAIDQAKEGVYPAERMATFAENYARAGGNSELGRYFTTAYDHIALGEPLRRNILFFQHNLVSDHVFGEMHVVFCRNVLIYFARELRGRVLDKLSHALVHGGFLCLGASERITSADHRLELSELDAQERIYRHAPV
jgi:chemotaxis protein methyltransferase CheR